MIDASEASDATSERWLALSVDSYGPMASELPRSISRSQRATAVAEFSSTLFPRHRRTFRGAGRNW